MRSRGVAESRQCDSRRPRGLGLSVWGGMSIFRNRRRRAGTEFAGNAQPLPTWLTTNGGKGSSARPHSGQGVTLYEQAQSSLARRTGSVAGLCCGRTFGRLYRVVLPLAGAAMLSACAVGPDFRIPDLPPVKGYLPRGADRALSARFVKGGDVPATWWELFHSRYLHELIEQGIIHN